MILSYEISEDLVLSIWSNADKTGDPMLLQPSHPEKDYWESLEECTAWAETFIEEFDVPEHIKNPSLDEPEPVEEEPVEETPVEEEPSD